MPGRGKVEPSLASFCSDCSCYLSKPECKGLETRELLRAAAVPFSQVHLRRSAGPWALLPAWGSPKGILGGRAVPLQDRPRGKVRAGPFHADAGGFCQQSLAYLPPLWLFAFGEARAGWGLGKPERRSLGAGRAFKSHLLQLLAVEGRRGPGWERPAKDAQGTAPTGLWRADFSRTAYVAHRLGPRPSSAHRRLGGSRALPPWSPSSCARHSAVRDLSRRAADLLLLLRIFRGGREGGGFLLPHIPPPWKLLGGTCLPAWARVVPLLPGEERGTPRTLHLVAGWVPIL